MDRQVDCPDASLPGAAALGQLLGDALPQAPAESDALGGARLDAMGAEAHRAPADERVEKSADPALVYRARDALWHWEEGCSLAPSAAPV
jgi:hypothetical protein